MGLRLFSRRNWMSRASHSQAARQLQWGSGSSAGETSTTSFVRVIVPLCFNGAPALQPEKLGRRPVRRLRGDEASMGLRLFSRRNGEADGAKAGKQNASMGLGLFSRRNEEAFVRVKLA